MLFINRRLASKNTTVKNKPCVLMPACLFYFCHFVFKGGLLSYHLIYFLNIQHLTKSHLHKWSKLTKTQPSTDKSTPVIIFYCV